MTLTTGLALAIVLCYATKLVGYLIPTRHLDHPLVTRIATTVTIGLLAALVAVNAFVAAGALRLDARLAGLAAAALALRLRLPFLVVVVVGAAATAGCRAAFG